MVKGEKIMKDKLAKYSKGSNGKTLWCWECKRKIKKGELIYPIANASGKFICNKCKPKD